MKFPFVENIHPYGGRFYSKRMLGRVTTFFYFFYGYWKVVSNSGLVIKKINFFFPSLKT